MSASTEQAARPGPDAPAPDLRSRLRAVAPLESKLRQPRPRPGIVTRTALVERVRTAEPVVVISASAGYGKTTLLAQWAASDDRPFACLTITDGDNDLTTLVAYLVLALDRVDPLPPETLASFTAPGASGATVLLPRLGRAVAERSRPFVLALDDVHLLTDADCLSALSVLVSHLPEGSQLALATRHDPPLARARLRARGTLMELRAEDLVLSPAEGAEALRDAGLELDEAAAATLVERTEGWAAGIYLAALAVRGLPDAEEAALRFAGDHRMVADFLRDELIDGLDVEVVEFLTRTSVLEHLDGPGCDALLERTGSWAVLEELAHSNLFVVPLDTAGELYRYHHLFSDVLRVELRRREAALEPVLHRRASDIFAARGQLDLAVQHAHESGDIARAVELVWSNAVPFLGSGRSGTVQRWLSLFSPEQVIAHPALPLATAWCCVTTPEPRPFSDLIDLARAHDLDEPLPDGTPLGSAIALLEAVAGEQGLGRMVESAATAIALDRNDSDFRFVAEYLEGAGLMLLGRPEEALVHLDEAARAVLIVPGTAAGTLAQLALMAAGSGSWGEAEDKIGRALAIVEEHHLSQLPAQASVFAVSALVRAHRGDAEGARTHANHARRLVSLLNYLGVWLAIEAHVVLARVELLLGEVEAARVLAREARDLVSRLPDPGVLPDRIADVFAAIEAGAQSGSDLSAAPLTTAELRVLSYLPTHLSFQAMAEDLFVSRNTVKTQAISIYRKLGVSSRGDAVERARELGLLEL